MFEINRIEKDEGAKHGFSSLWLPAHQIPLMTISGTQDLISGIENILLGVSSFGKKSYTLVDERKS